MKIAVLAAIKNEAGPIEKILGAQAEGAACGQKAFSARLADKKITIVLTGMGVKNAGSCAAEVLASQRPDLVISAGFAGALYPDAAYGDIVCPDKAWLYPDNRSVDAGGPGFETLYSKLLEKTAARRGPVITLSKWAEKPAVKDYLSGFAEGAQGPAVCDMETFPLALAALEGGCGFFGIRAVSDKADEAIGFDPLEIAAPDGHISAMRAARKFAANPRLIHLAVRLKRSSEAAAPSLARAVCALIESL